MINMNASWIIHKRCSAYKSTNEVETNFMYIRLSRYISFLTRERNKKKKDKSFIEASRLENDLDTSNLPGETSDFRSVEHSFKRRFVKSITIVGRLRTCINST